MLGFYNSQCKRLGWNKADLVNNSLLFANSMGVKTLPAVPKRTLSKMGLLNCPGLNSAEDTPRRSNGRQGAASSSSSPGGRAKGGSTSSAGPSSNSRRSSESASGGTRRSASSHSSSSPSSSSRGSDQARSSNPFPPPRGAAGPKTRSDRSRD